MRLHSGHRLIVSPDCTASFACAFFLLRDFVEMVFTYGRNLGEATEKRIVHRRHRAFLWTNDNIIDSVFCEQGGSIIGPGIDLLNLGLAWARIDSVRPDVTGVAHDRPAAGQKDGCVMYRRVKNRRPRWRLLFHHLRESHTVTIELLIFTLPGDEREYVQTPGESQQYEKNSGRNSMGH